LRRAQRDPPPHCATLSVEFATASCTRRSSLVALIAEASAMTIYNLELLVPIPSPESWSLGGQPIVLRARKKGPLRKRCHNAGLLLSNSMTVPIVQLSANQTFRVLHLWRSPSINYLIICDNKNPISNLACDGPTARPLASCKCSEARGFRVCLI
jgi:hypothetical protein